MASTDMTPPTDGVRIRFMTQNIWAKYGDWPMRRRGLAALFGKVAPDILVLQEAVCTEEIDQLAELGIDRLPHRAHQAHYADADMPGAHESGIAIAARWPFDVVAHEDLRLNPDDVGRSWGALAVRFDFGPTLGQLLVVGSKPSWQLDREATRAAQAVRLARLVRQHRGRMPSVLLGDFDATPEATSMRFLTGLQPLEGESTHFVDAWRYARPAEPGYTWTTDNPTAVPEIARLVGPGRHERRLDYILLQAFDPARRVDGEIVSCDIVGSADSGQAPPSDHYGVVADIAFSLRSTAER